MGNLYSWGKGNIGHKGPTNEELPRKIEINTDNRIFTEIFVNQDTAVAFAPIWVYSISPNCGPSTGGTLLSIIGTGFLNSDWLKVRFQYGELIQEIPCSFDDHERSILCRTPRFDEINS